YKLSPGETVWVVQAGWGTYLPQDLKRQFAEFRDLNFESFGKNILIFKLTVGQPMPAIARQANFIFPPADSGPEPAE
ncbi:MAG: hypothetical protein WA653_12075, partial [Candidatus Sulfotelmatobacter sp.]